MILSGWSGLRCKDALPFRTGGVAAPGNGPPTPAGRGVAGASVGPERGHIPLRIQQAIRPGRRILCRRVKLQTADIAIAPTHVAGWSGQALSVHEEGPLPWPDGKITLSTVFFSF